MKIVLLNGDIVDVSSIPEGNILKFLKEGGVLEVEGKHIPVTAVAYYESKSSINREEDFVPENSKRRIDTTVGGLRVVGEVTNDQYDCLMDFRNKIESAGFTEGTTEKLVWTLLNTTPPYLRKDLSSIKPVAAAEFYCRQKDRLQVFLDPKRYSY